MAVVVNFRHEGVAEKQVAEAELLFIGDDMGPLAGMKLVGFRVWRGEDTEGDGGDLYVTFPSRAFGTFESGGRRYFDFLRAQDGHAALVRRMKAWILSEYLAYAKAKETRA